MSERFPPSKSGKRAGGRNWRHTAPMRAGSVWQEKPVGGKRAAAEKSPGSTADEDDLRADHSPLDQQPAGTPGDTVFPDEPENPDQTALARRPRRAQKEREAAQRTQFFLLLPIAVLLVIWVIQLFASS